MKTYKIANDLGYSSMKFNIDGQKEHIPSIIAIQRPQNITKPVVFDTPEEESEYYRNLSQHMDVTVTSPSVSLQGRFLVGKRAIEAGIPTRAFDVNDFSGKSKSDLSLILTLSRIANQVVTDAYKNKQPLNEVIKATVLMSTALPITEGKTKGAIDAYRKRYLKGKHLVNILNFEQPITVELTFKDVYVGFEGEMAQFKIANADPTLKQQILNDFENSYPSFKGQMSGDDLINLKNILGIDIGEGTTDFVVVTNGKANPTVSTSLETGYGNVLQDAVSLLQHDGMNISNRGELNDFLAKDVSILTKGRQDHARQVVFDQLEQLVDQIIDATSETMRHANSDIELVYVYGGGSIPLLKNSDMRTRLVNKLKGFAGGYDIPVIWIDPSRAQTLNEDGLKLVVDNIFE
jgi:plasmid segregation protein ParM